MERKAVEAWVSVRDGRVGVFVYDSEASARRAASKGHEVVRLVEPSPGRGQIHTP